MKKLLFLLLAIGLGSCSLLSTPPRGFFIYESSELRRRTDKIKSLTHISGRLLVNVIKNITPIRCIHLDFFSAIHFF